MRAAGIWPTRRHLVTAVGETLVARVPRNHDGWSELAQLLAQVPDLEVALPGPLQAIDPVVEHLRIAQVPVWIVPTEIADAIAHLAGVRMRAAHTLARALARMLERDVLHALLVAPDRPPDRRQLRLL